MATREIKTTIALDGEQKFKQALSAATREMRVMESELKAVSAAYDVNGNKAEFFAAKQKNIRDQISQQRQIIEALEKAVEDAAKAYGEGSTQVDGYAIRLNNARTRMSRLEKELEATDREVEELGRDSVRAGRQLEDGIGDGAENAERSVKDLMQTMQKDIGSIKTSTAFTAVSGLWDMATSAYSSVAGFVEGTAEYRRELSKLEHAAKTNGFDLSDIKDQLTEVAGATGDATGAMQGLVSLLNIGMTERQMESAVDALLGATVEYPELNFDSLSQDFQETIAKGEASGSFLELLEKTGQDVEAFNKALEESPTLAGDLDIALAYLAAGGLKKSYEAFRKNNEEMVKAGETQAKLEQELAEFGGTLEQYIVTPVKSLLVDALEWVNDTIKVAEEQGIGAAAQKVGTDVINAIEESGEEAVAAAVETAFSSKETNQQIVKNNMAMREAVITAVMKLFGILRNDDTILPDDTFIGPPTLEQQKYREEAVRQEMGKGFIAGFAASIAGPEALEQQKKMQALLEEAAAFQKAQQAWYEMHEGSGQKPSALWPGVTQLETVEDAVDITDLLPTTDFEAAGQEAGAAFVNGLETELDLSLFGEGRPAESYLKTNPVEKWEETIRNEEDSLRDAGEDAGEALGEGLESATESFASMARMLGSNFGASVAAGMASQHSYVYAASAALRSAAESAWGGSGSTSSSTRYTRHNAGSSDLINIALNLDGREFARVATPYIATQLTAP